MDFRVGLIGLGDMGVPMAGCLADAGLQPLVWARRPESAEPLLSRGARRAASVDDLCAKCDHIVLMLAHCDAMDEVLGRGTVDFDRRVVGKTIIHMGTTPPSYSEDLGKDIKSAGGRYAEVPVSGSTGPAATGDLVAMAAGDAEVLADIEATIAPMCRATVFCGSVPKALQMKLAVNTYLAGLATGLFESFNYARRADLDLETLSNVLKAGPMNCDLMQMKIPKLVNEDYAPQGSIRQMVNNMTMITDEGARVGAAMPVAGVILELAREAYAAGWTDEDMSAVVKALSARCSASA